MTLVALTSTRMVIVFADRRPTPLFSLVISLIFLRGEVTGATVFGTVAVVAGTVAIAREK